MDEKKGEEVEGATTEEKWMRRKGRKKDRLSMRRDGCIESRHRVVELMDRFEGGRG